MKCRRRGDNRVALAPFDPQAAALQGGKGVAFALRDLRFAQGMMIGGSRRVDEDQQPFGRGGGSPFGGGLAVIAVLGANIDGRRAGQLAPAEYVVEFLPVMIGKEDRMAKQGKAIGLRDKVEG